MRRRRLLAAAASATAAGPVATTAMASSAGAPRRPRPGGTAAASGAAIGPLAASPGGRYFARPDGRQVFLAGSHVWTNLQDANGGDPPVPFDHGAYLDLLRSEGHNFIRLWCWESPRVAGEHAGSGGYLGFADPLPYRRTGPGEDAAGKPRFDLNAFDEAYFDRLRARVRAAGERGIHVGVMLWNTWSVHRYQADPALDPWRHHPYNARNNVNGIDGDPHGTGDGAAGVQTLAIPAITALQEAYARKVVDTLNDLDNVLYEISNEPIGDAATAAWQNHMIGFLRGCQAGRPKRHPIGMTAGFKPDPGTINAQLRDSGADWISPALAEAAVHDPPEAEGGKVSLLDTDHLPGGPFDALWMWKAFTRGHNLLVMDALEGLGIGGLLATWGAAHAAVQDSGRRGLRGTLAAAALLGDMAGMRPLGALCSTGYALADPGRAYVALAPEGGRVTLDLSAAAGRTFVARWIAVENAALRRVGTVAGGGAASVFDLPAMPTALVLTPPPA